MGLDDFQIIISPHLLIYSTFSIVAFLFLYAHTCIFVAVSFFTPSSYSSFTRFLSLALNASSDEARIVSIA